MYNLQVYQEYAIFFWILERNSENSQWFLQINTQSL